MATCRLAGRGGASPHIHPATKRFIDVLTLDVDKWEDAAKRVDELLPHLHPSEVEGWMETARDTGKTRLNTKP
jgi:hypothetical protein